MFGLPDITVSHVGHYLYASTSEDRAVTRLLQSLPYSTLLAEDEMWKIPWSRQAKAILQSENGNTAAIDFDGDWEADAPDAPNTLLKEGPNYGLPFEVTAAWRDDIPEYLKFLPGVVPSQDPRTFYYTEEALPSLIYKVSIGELTDPKGVLVAQADTLIALDRETGEFIVVGNDDLAAAMDRHFPEKDVYGAAVRKGISVDFMDELSRNAYYGQHAKASGMMMQPEGMRLELFDYQKKAVAFAVDRDRAGAACFYAPGLGKTPVGIASGLEFIQSGRVDKVIICPPGAVAQQWREEILKFTDTPRDAIMCIAPGTPADKREKMYATADDYPWVIAHHALLARDAEYLLPMSNNAYLVIDEAHKMSSPSAARTKAVRQMSRDAYSTLALTGTPVRNSVEDWHAILSELTSHDSLGELKQFNARYRNKETINITTRTGREMEKIVYTGAKNINNLKARTTHGFIRATKETVAPDMPPLTVKILELRPSEEYAGFLRDAHLNAEAAIEAGDSNETETADDTGDKKKAGTKLTALGALRALCSSPKLLSLSDSDSAKAMAAAGLVPDDLGPKVQWLTTMAKVLQEDGERALVFSYSRKMVKLLEEKLTAEGIRVVTYHGETTEAERTIAVDEFQGVKNNINPTIMLATDAASEGINLGKRCSTVINLDLPWTPGNLEQRSNRVHRIDGTHESYLVINVVLAGTVEPHIMGILEEKSFLSDALLGEERSPDILGSEGKIKMNLIKTAFQRWESTQNNEH